MSSPSSQGLTRRQSLGVLATSVALPACLHQAQYTAQMSQRGQVFVPQEQLAVLKGPADVLMVHADGALGPLAVRLEGSGRYRALLVLCTHRGCELSALPQSYDCPCHGSRFDLLGEVLQGPAEKPLARLPVAVAPEGLTIALAERAP